MLSFKFTLSWIPVSWKLGPYRLQLCKKNCCKLDFQVFPEQILFRGVFKPLHLRYVTAKIVSAFINILIFFSQSFILDVLLLNPTFKINVIAKIMFLNILNIFSKKSIFDVLLSSEFFSALTQQLLKRLQSEFTLVKSVILIQKSFISR